MNSLRLRVVRCRDSIVPDDVSVQGIAFVGPLVCMLACSVLTPGPGESTQAIAAMIVGILSGV